MRTEHKVVTITATGGNRCPVSLLDTYISKLPVEARKRDLFYCRPHPTVPKNVEDPWYMNSPVGKNKLYTMVKDMFEEAGISGKSNHSLRVAGASSLFSAGVPERIIQGRTGHVSVEALRKYERVTQTQELAVSNILAGKEESFESSGAVPKTEKKVLAPVPPSGAQYNHCTFNVSYSAPPLYHGAFPGPSLLPLPPIPSAPGDFSSDTPLEQDE